MLSNLLRQAKNLYHLVTAIFWAWKMGFPGRELKVVGVTGTDGKTSTTHMTYALLRASGVKVAMISTIQAVIGDEVIPTGLHVTSPAPSFLQPLLRRIVSEGYEAVILEVTSHALDQHRVWGIDFDIAVVTNIGSDHLDYHGTEREYARAKAKLFGNFAHGRHKGLPKTAVLNRADSSFDLLKNRPCTLQYWYNSAGEDTESVKHVSAENLVPRADGTELTLRVNGKALAATLAFIGRYNVDNAQAALSVALAFGVTPEAAILALPTLPAIPGRMQLIKRGQPFTCFVDFAHTPAALEHALDTLGALPHNRLIVLFGCAGQRDPARRQMGRVAAERADVIIATNEDNRDEDIHKIVGEIVVAAKTAGAIEGDPKAPKLDQTPVIFALPDRKQAIEFAVSMAQSGDILDCSGKGHEQSLNVDEKELPWDEVTAVKQALAKYGYTQDL